MTWLRTKEFMWTYVAVALYHACKQFVKYTIWFVTADRNGSEVATIDCITFIKFLGKRRSWFLSVKNVKTQFMTEWRNEDWTFLQISHMWIVKTEGGRLAENVKIKGTIALSKRKKLPWEINSCEFIGQVNFWKLQKMTKIDFLM